MEYIAAATELETVTTPEELTDIPDTLV